jgi:hypothetical protein
MQLKFTMRLINIIQALFAVPAAAQSIATTTASAASATSSANVTTINAANPVDSQFDATVWALIVSRTSTNT